MLWYLSAVIQAFVISMALSNCTTFNQHNQQDSTYASFEELKANLLNRKPDLRMFREDGPFDYQVLRNFDIRVSQDIKLTTDVYFANTQKQAPLIIMQHGNLAHKGVHENQARRLASWGMHTMVVSQPNKGQWVKNGHTLSNLVKLIYQWPELLDNRFDRQNIIIAGHSFGGSAIAIAAGSEAPVKGLIFLDPALVNSNVRRYIRRIHVPAVLLGADLTIFKSRKRKDFFRLVKEDIIEVSFKNATHNDAQSPNLFSLTQLIGIDYATDEDRQQRFMAAITASAFSMASTGHNDYAWSAFQSGIKRGYIIQPKRK